MQSIRRYLLIFVILIFSLPNAVQPSDSGIPSSDSVISINNIQVDKITKTITVKVQLALKEGILEYLLVGDEGKTYESVFKLAGNRPSDLNFALLLIGAEPLNYQIFQTLLQKPGGSEELLAKYRKSLIEIAIYRESNKVELGRLIKNRESAAVHFLWAFTGSKFLEDNRYAGDYELSYIGIWPDQTAVINMFSTLKNPYRGEFGFEMKGDGLEVGQNFNIILRRLTQ